MKSTATLNWVTPVVFGAGKVSTVGAELKARGCTKALIFHGKSVGKTELPGRIKGYLDEAGIAYVESDDSESDPSEGMINRVGEFARKEGVNGIIAIGGGSCIDAAKGIKVLVNNPGEIRDYFLGSQNPQKNGAPLIAVPTTSGTGSEVDRVGMVTDGQTGAKRVLIGPGCAPELAIVDAELTVTCPPGFTAGCGFDALAHHIDGALSNLVSDVVLHLNYTGIRLIKENLKKAVDNGNDLDARAGLHMASMLGGVSIANANCSVAHSMAHGLGAAYHISHGTCCAIFTPACLEYVAETCPDIIKEIGKIIGADVSGGDAVTVARSVSTAIYKWYRDCGIKNIMEVVPNKDECAEKMLPIALADVNHRFCAKPCDEAALKWIFDRTYEMAAELG